MVSTAAAVGGVFVSLRRCAATNAPAAQPPRENSDCPTTTAACIRLGSRSLHCACCGCCDGAQTTELPLAGPRGCPVRPYSCLPTCLRRQTSRASSANMARCGCVALLTASGIRAVRCRSSGGKPTGTRSVLLPQKAANTIEGRMMSFTAMCYIRDAHPQSACS